MWGKKNWVKIGVTIILFTILRIVLHNIFSIYTDKSYEWLPWTGFNEKTTWDVIEKIFIPTLIPITVAITAYLFNRSEKRRRELFELERRNDNILNDYLTRIGNLLMEQKLGPENLTSPPIRNYVKVLTSTTMNKLDKSRQKIIFEYIQKSELNHYIFTGSCFSNMDFSEIDFNGFNFSDSKLISIDFSNCQMEKIKFCRAVIEKSKMCGIKATDSDLSNARFNNVNLNNAILSGCNAENVWFYYCEMERINFANSNLTRTHFYGNLKYANLSYTTLIHSILDANMEGANLNYANLTSAYIDENQLESAFVYHTILSNGQMDEKSRKEIKNEEDKQ